MLEEFNSLMERIDINIQNKKIYDDPILLKNTTELLSSANILLSKQKNVHNDYFQNEFLESCYNQIKIRKDKLSDITNQYKNQIAQKKKKKIIFDESDYLLNEEYNKFDNDIALNPNYELGLITNLNESLLTGSVKNLYNIKNNVEITAQSLKEQGEKLNSLSTHASSNEENVKMGTKLIDSISCNQKCRKFLLFIINILLFVVIIMVFLYKIL
jgi:hypothetical protein